MILPAHIDKKYINILSSQLDSFSWKKDNLANCRCCICGDSQKKITKTRLYFYEKKNKYLVKCHNCGYASDIYGFMEKENPALFKEYRLELWKEKNTPVTNCTGKNDMLSMLKKPEFNKHQDLLKPLTCITNLPDNHPAVEFVKFRQIPKLNWKLLFYCKSFGEYARLLDPGNKECGYEERLIIPIFNKKGNVVAAQGRLISMHGEHNARTTLRYITVKADKSIDRLWYGMWRANPKKRVYVVEGPIDSLFISNAIAMVGSGAMENIHKRFDNSNITYVLDNEPRNSNIAKYNKRLIEQGKDVCIWPNEIKEKDINDMIYRKSANEIKKLIDMNTFSGLEATLRLNKWRKS